MTVEITESVFQEDPIMQIQQSIMETTAGDWRQVVPECYMDRKGPQKQQGWHHQ